LDLVGFGLIRSDLARNEVALRLPDSRQSGGAEPVPVRLDPVRKDRERFPETTNFQLTALPSYVKEQQLETSLSSRLGLAKAEALTHTLASINIFVNKKSKHRHSWSHLETAPNRGRANLPVCLPRLANRL